MSRMPASASIYGVPIGDEATGYGRGQTLSPDVMAKAYLALEPGAGVRSSSASVRSSRATYRLDPDLASNRSFSLSAKLSVQRAARHRPRDREDQNSSRTATC